MASPFLLSNVDLQYPNLAGQDFSCYVAFLNPVAITTTWNDLNMDAQGNWLAPPNYDTANNHVQPYAPTCNMGSNRIGFVGEPLYFDGSLSCTRHDLPVVPNSYLWNASNNATITLYNGGSQCAITWSSPGLYSLSLTVADLAGTRTTGIRQVMIYQDRLSALPGVISISGLSGSLSNGGWQAQLTTVNSQVTLFAPDSLPVGTYQPMVIMTETKYEVMPGYWQSHTIGPDGNFSPGYPYQDARILFDGYVQSGTIHQDVDKDTLSFSCIGPQMILQESKTHQLGYYNSTYTALNGSVPLGINTTPNGQGFLVGDLTSADVIHSLLQTHCPIGTYHDIHVWNANIPTGPFTNNNFSDTSYYNLIYTNLSINEGTIWSNIQDITSNEWAQVYCERDGSIRVGPQINYRGNEYWSLPTLLGPTAAPFLINYVRDLGFTVADTLTKMPGSIPILPASPIPVIFVHPWGHRNVPPLIAHPFQEIPSPDVVTTQNGLNGPPILCVFSDVPDYDPAALPPAGISLFPWVSANWPQDLAVYPVAFDITENYTGRTSLVKLIGTMANVSQLFTCWYPQNVFSVAGDGSSTIVASVIPAGNWLVDESHLLADVTYPQNRQLMSNWWWEMARRVYFAQNINYSASITLGMMTGVSLGDIVGITRQNNVLGPHWTNKPFYVQEISYGLDMTQKTWTTTLTTVEVTSALLGPIQPPPAVVPR